MVARIKELGGQVEAAEKGLGRAGLRVWFYLATVSEEAMTQLGKLARLRELQFQEVRVTSAALDHLKGLTRLRSLSLLSLDGTPVTEKVMGIWKGCPTSKRWASKAARSRTRW